MNLKPLIFLFFIAAALSLKAQTDNPVNNLSKHPHLLLTAGEERVLIEKIQTDVYKKAVHNEIIRECDLILNEPPVERIKLGMRLLHKSREALLRIFYLSYAWRITADDRYLERAEKELVAISKFSDWNPSHFLDVAEMTMAAAIGYDWLYDRLSPDTKLVIRNAIIEKGLKPSFDEKNNWWIKASNNWNQVCNTGMLFGALAIYEDDPQYAQEIIKRGRESIKLPMKDYEPDGAYPEGYMYWGYGTTYNVLFINEMEKLSGGFDLSENPGFLKTAYYMQNMTGPTGDSFNYSDSDLGGVLQPAMFWFAKKTKDQSLLWVEKEHMRKLSANVREDNRLLPLTLIWSKDVDLENISAPKEKLWTGRGKTPVAMMRSSWTDSNAVYVGFKGGSASTNHSHMDIGSFIMEANGVRWAMDFGRQDYQSLESKKVNIWESGQNSQRWKVFRYHNFSHNTLAVNNQLQDVKGNASLSSSSESKNIISAEFDLSSVYPDLSEAKREIAIIKNKQVVVTDNLKGGESSSLVRWSMLTSANVKITGKRKAQLLKDNKKLILKVRGVNNLRMKTWSTVPPNDYDASNDGTTFVGFEFELPEKSNKRIEVLLLPKK